ncbi:MAG: class I SAM-dependent methyltransferase, partial [Candidatus Heimdallarchaeota archaeon]
NLNSISQIVFLGAGLDTRAYRFTPLKTNVHKVFEIDFPYVISHKERIMKNKVPLCDVIRIPTDLTESDWSYHLLRSSFHNDIPTFWILEGLVYYLEKSEVKSLITDAARMSSEGSQIFMDIIQPSKFFRSLSSYNDNKKIIDLFFESTGWEVSLKLVNDYNLYQDVINDWNFFIHGKRIKMNKLAKK